MGQSVRCAGPRLRRPEPTFNHQAQCFTARPPPKQIRGVNLKHRLFPRTKPTYLPARPRWNLKVLLPCAFHSHLGATWQPHGCSRENASSFLSYAHDSLSIATAEAHQVMCSYSVSETRSQRTHNSAVPSLLITAYEVPHAPYHTPHDSRKKAALRRSLKVPLALILPLAVLCIIPVPNHV
jgi:hypothetical protein